MYISEDQKSRTQEITEQLEKRTGVELVAVVVDKCDTYPEIPWKAFAVGAAVGALVLSIQSVIRPAWFTVYREIFLMLTVLGTGMTAALLSIFWPPFTRLFLDGTRAEVETKQYAQSFFLEREIFSTRERTGILLLISLLEHKVVILPDSGIRSRIDPKTLNSVISHMASDLREGNCFQALEGGLTVLEKSLLVAGFKGVDGAPDEIPDEFIQQKGSDR